VFVIVSLNHTRNGSDKVIMFEWIEFLREQLTKKLEDIDKTVSIDQPSDTSCDDDVNSEDLPVPIDPHCVVVEKVQCPMIYHGEPLTDRKSTFQAHVAEVTSVDRVTMVIQELKTSRKIATATHNIVAYRIHDVPRGVCIQDCDDDGESAAGSRLLHLLQVVRRCTCKTSFKLSSCYYTTPFVPLHN